MNLKNHLPLEEVIMNKGLKYEKRLFQEYKDLNLVPHDFKPAGSSNQGHDLELILCGHTLGIELKLNKKAQMGGTSFKINDDSITPKKPFFGQEKVILDIINKKEDYENFLNFFNKEKVPFVTELELWNEAKNLGLLANCNINTHFVGFDFIKEHYQAKNTGYIQIGGLGLFSLNHINPLNAPQFDADLELQTRFIRGSSKYIKSKPEKVCSVSLRVQARITKTFISSLLDLEKPETIIGEK